MPEGACLCGAIKYRLADITSNHYNTVCHCLNCKKWTGSSFLTAAICPKEGFEITQGEKEYMKTYVDKFTDSGQPLTRAFCQNCGSNLFAFTPLRDYIVSVAAGSLDDCQDWIPNTEQYCLHRPPYLEKCAGVNPERRFVEAVGSKAESEAGAEQTEMKGIVEG